MRNHVIRSALVLWFSATLNAQEPIRIFAAASLADALTSVVAEFADAHPTRRVSSQFGGSSDLARQIMAGAPAHLFFSADRRQLDRIAAEGFIAEGEQADVLSNQLVIVGHFSETSEPNAIDEPADLANIGRLAMADPEAVPAGVYARRFLESQGLWSSLRLRVVPTLDVRGALAAVASGNVDVGIVYRTDASIEERVKILYTVPKEQGPPIFYSLGIIRRAPDGDTLYVRALYDYIQSDAAGRVFQRFGFIVVDPEPADRDK